MHGNSTISRELVVIVVAIALGIVVGLAAAPHKAEAGGGPVAVLPHETGALAGTSETFLDMRPDGSYYDPSLGRRVAGAGGSKRDRLWPHETGATAGTGETFVDMRADGSYYDPSLERRVAGAVDAKWTSDGRRFARSVGNIQPGTVPEVVSSRGFDWEDGVVGGAFGLALALLGTGAATAYRRRSTLRRA